MSGVELNTMSSKVKPKLIHRLKLGKLQVSLYGRPRQKPVVPELADAVEQLKKAVLNEFAPLLDPIVKWLARCLRKRGTS